MTLPPFRRLALGAVLSAAVLIPAGLASAEPTPVTISAVTDTRAYDGTTASSVSPVVSAGTPLAAGDRLDEATCTQAFDAPGASATDGRTLSVSSSCKIEDATTEDDHTANYTITFDTAQGTITKAGPVVTYTGTSGIVPLNGAFILSGTVSPAGCGPLTYLVNGSVVTTFTPSSGGIYEVQATSGPSENCEGGADNAVAVVGTSGDSTNGGGWYKVPSEISGNPRINFGHTVQKQVTTDKKTGYVTTTYRGQMLWVNTNAWRLKGAVYSRTVTNAAGQYQSGDMNPAYGKVTCPPEVGTTGSNPACGAFVGSGTLQYWDADTMMWKAATSLGIGGQVAFTATVYDGGSISACKKVGSKTTCTVTAVADWFGLGIAGITTANNVPVGPPVLLQKSQNGNVLVR